MLKPNQEIHLGSVSDYTEIDLLNEYNDVYIVRAVNYIKSHFTIPEIFKILNDALLISNEQLDIDLDETTKDKNMNNQEAFKIKAIFSVLHRILTGTLTTEDNLMSNLLKISTDNNIDRLNSVVKQHITLSVVLPELNAFPDQNSTEAHSPKV